MESYIYLAFALKDIFNNMLKEECKKRFIECIRNFTSSPVTRDIWYPGGYKRNDSFIHLSKYGRFSNDCKVNFPLFSSRTVSISFLTQSCINNIH